MKAKGEHNMLQWEMIAHGRVQGVGFRWFVRHTALQLGVGGYVRNLADGSVYIIAEADECVLSSFKDQLHIGNGYSRVDYWEIYRLDSNKRYHEFEIR